MPFVQSLPACRVRDVKGVERLVNPFFSICGRFLAACDTQFSFRLTCCTCQEARSFVSLMASYCSFLVCSSYPDPCSGSIFRPAFSCRYPSLIKYSVTDSKQLVVDNAFVVKATLETTGEPVKVAPRYLLSLVGGGGDCYDVIAGAADAAFAAHAAALLMGSSSLVLRRSVGLVPNGSKGNKRRKDTMWHGRGLARDA